MFEKFTSKKKKFKHPNIKKVIVFTGCFYLFRPHKCKIYDKTKINIKVSKDKTARKLKGIKHSAEAAERNCALLLILCPAHSLLKQPLDFFI